MDTGDESALDLATETIGFHSTSYVTKSSHSTPLRPGRGRGEPASIPRGGWGLRSPWGAFERWGVHSFPRLTSSRVLCTYLYMDLNVVSPALPTLPLQGGSLPMAEQPSPWSVAEGVGRTSAGGVARTPVKDGDLFGSLLGPRVHLQAWNLYAC